MVVLVTGGLGYLGGRIVQALVGRPAVRVRVLAHGGRPLPHGFPDAVDVRRGDVLEPASLRGICDGLSHAIHLAGPDQAACRKSPADALLVGAIGTLNVAEEAAAAGVRRLLFVSSIHVYGAAATDRLREDTPLRPVNPYGVSRMAGEAFAGMVARRRGISAAVLRVSNGYGPPAYPGTTCWNLVVNDLCRQAVRRGEIVLRGAGTETRDFVAVTDIVRAVELFAAVPDAMLGEGVFNIGGDRLRRILEIAECVRETFADMSGRQVPIHIGTSATPEPPMPHVDISRARALGYAPRADLRTEVRRTLEAAGGPLGDDRP